MTNFEEYFRAASENLGIRLAQESRAAHSRQYLAEQERARKQPYIDMGNAKYRGIISEVIKKLENAGIPEDNELYDKTTKCWTIHPLEDKRRPFYGMRIVSPELTIWQKHDGNSVSYNNRPLRVADLTDYPDVRTIKLAESEPNLYYNPRTSGLFLSEKYLNYDDYIQPQIDIVEWLAKATAAKVRGLV